MPLATRTELLEIVPELRAMAAQSKTTTVRETLNMLANRYAALAAGTTDPTPQRRLDIACPLSRSRSGTALRS
jgi:hypothetical protein